MADFSSQKEIEAGLKECGVSLINLPSSTEELIGLLDKVESLLFKVGQAPVDSMKDALLPAMTALVRSELLKHTDADVKISVVSCINEISRISAPQQPYNDELMKEIFQLTVRVFEELSHSGRCYHKTVNVLETMAEVKACVMLLDLECDALVIEIFQMFLRIIRCDHPSVVFTSMEVIMILLIEESDEIKMELLQPLLDSLRKENKIWSPISSKLGEKVLKECASTVRPCLLEALKSGSMNLDDYTETVVSICNEMPDGEQMTENEDVTDAVNSAKVGQSDSVICETLLADGMPLNNNGTCSKTLQHHNQMEQLKNTGFSNGSHGNRRRAKKKDTWVSKDAQLEMLVPEGVVLQSQDKRNGSLHSVLNFENEHKGISCSKRKPHQSSRKSGSVSKGDVDTTSGLNIVKREGNFTDAEELSVQHIDEKKQKNDRATIEIHDTEESGDEEIKLSFGDENLSSKFSKTKRRRKLTMRKDKDSKRPLSTNKYGEEIVGNRIKVWWPLDRVFYEGIISTFDPVKKKHQITYDDGETEILNLDKERFEILKDNPSNKKHEGDLECNAVSSVPSVKKKTKRTSSIKKEPGASSSKRSKRNPQKSVIESMDIPIPDKMNDATGVGCETSSGNKELVDEEDNDITQKQRPKTSKVDLESSLTLENHPSDKRHETDLQSNDVSAVLFMKKKVKETSSMEKEPGVSSSKRSMMKKAMRTPSTKKKPGISTSKRSKRKPQKSEFESLVIPIPDKMNDTADVGCETSSEKKELVDKEDNNITQKQRSMTCKVALESSLSLEVHPSEKKHETDLQSNDVSSSLSPKKKAKRTFSIKREQEVTSSKRSKRNPQNSNIESLDIPVPDKMNDASDVGCETSSGKEQLVDREDNMNTEAESKTLEVALESSVTLVHSQQCQNEGS
ncbi:unnamed protein product [Withania somnifera]